LKGREETSRGPKAKILVLEDDPKMLEVLASVLEDNGYEVTRASNGEEAVEQTLQSSFDLIVADIRMEGMSGLDAVQKSQEQQPEIGTLIVSGYATPENTARAMKLQAGKILAKPFKLSDFLRRVEEQLTLNQRFTARSARHSASQDELLWALDLVVRVTDLPPPDRPVGDYRNLAETLAKKMGLSDRVCSEVGLAAALASGSLAGQVPPGLLENQNTLTTLKYCLNHHEDPQDIEPKPRIEARIVAFVQQAWKNGVPVPASSFTEDEVQSDLLEAYADYLTRGASEKEQQRERADLRGLLEMAHTLRDLGRADGARYAYKQLEERAEGRVLLDACLGQARLELDSGNSAEVESLCQKALEEAGRFGPVCYATTLLSAGLLLYQAKADCVKVLKEAASELRGLRFDGSVALAAVALCDLGLMPDLKKLPRVLVVLTQPRYFEEVSDSANWLLPALLRLLVRVKDEANRRVVVQILGLMSQELTVRLRLTEFEKSVKLAFLETLQQVGSEKLGGALDVLMRDPEREIATLANSVAAKHSETDNIPLIRCRSLGAFRLFRGTEPVPDKDWKTKKVRYYFAYLASQWGSFLSDDIIIELFWPGKSREKGKQNLYWATSIMRRCVAGDEPKLAELVERREETLRLNPDVPHWHDLQELEIALHDGRTAHGQGDWSRGRCLLARAVQLYEGPYLEGYYEDWAVRKREALQLRLLDGLQLLSECCYNSEDYSGALEAARRILEIDYAQESAYKLSMTALLAQGKHTVAIAQYEQCRSILEKEYGMEPDDELELLYSQALDN
jgi:two-component SAPR family response regulator